MGHIPQVRDGHPQLKVFKLGRVSDLLRDVDSPLEADPVQLLLTELVYDLERHELVLFPQFVEIEVQRPGDDNLGKLSDYGCVNGNLQLYYL